jgi:hypothetical protein
MNRIIEAKADRALTEQELNAVSGGTLQKPNNIDKPIIPPQGTEPKTTWIIKTA